jgi:hypothetical protein
MQLDGILLANTSWRTNGALEHLTYDQVLAARDTWYANTVSLQLSSNNLFAQKPYDASYLAAVDQAVAWSNQLGMNILLVLQYEGYGNSFQKMPTQDSIDFWNVLSRHYADNPTVFFDLFNEPLPATLLGTSDNDAAWTFWQGGGDVDGVRYVGMQQIVDAIRGNGAQNLVLVDGLAAGEDIKLLPQHPLRGTNVAYAIHPYFNATQHHTPSDWDRWFGDAVSSADFPVVADEWSEYQSGRGECITDAPTVVPQFLAYLRNKSVGIIGYAFWPGTLIRGWDFRSPTRYDFSPTTCLPSSSDSNLGADAQGAGALLMEHLAANSVQPHCP